MKTVGVIGGGFGVYGYIPACAELGNVKALTLEKNEEKLLSRPELRKLHSNIRYVETEKQLIEESDIIVLVRRPFDNEALVKVINAKKLIIEKPIAQTPQKAIELYKLAESQSNDVYSGFILRYLPWYEKVMEIKQGFIKISWGIQKNNAHDSWKYCNDHGGGLLAFYGIHLLNLVAQMNVKLITANVDKIESSLNISFEDTERQLDICIFYSSQPSFSVFCDSRIVIFSAASPFGDTPKGGELDVRIEFLQQLLRDVLLNNNQQMISETINLWGLVMKKINT